MLGGTCGRHLAWAILAVLKANVVPTRKGDPINKALQHTLHLDEAFKS